MCSLAAATDSDVHPGEILGIHVMPHIGQSGWIIEFKHDGSVRVQYGSGPFDNLSMPKGTVHFPALIDAMERLRSDKKIDGGAQTSFARRGESSSTSFYLKDDTLLRYLIDSFAGKWHANNERALSLLKSHPIFSRE